MSSASRRRTRAGGAPGRSLAAAAALAAVVLLVAFAALAGGGGARRAARAEDLNARTDAPPPRRVLRVGADPNNLPFSNDRLEGFENRIAALVARELDAELRYTWHAQRRGFFRRCLKEDGVDLVLGVPVGFEMALPTKPYYRSTYVFVTRTDRHLDVRSLDDPSLRDLTIGVHLIGDDGSNAPPAHALARRGMVDNVRGYSIYGDYREPNPPARVVEAVADGEVDVAIVWGPLAGHFAKRHGGTLTVVPVTPAVDPPALRYQFSIAMGVRPGDAALKGELDGVIERNRAEIGRILAEYGVPTVPSPAAAGPSEDPDGG